MNYPSTLACTFFILTVSITNAAQKTLQSFVESGIVSAQIISTGDHEGECLIVKARNQTDSSIDMIVLAGSIFLSVDSAQQDIIITQDTELRLAANQSGDFPLVGFCCQSQNSAPSPHAAFTFGPSATGELQQTAQFLNAHRDLPLSEQQHAIWVLSDCHPLSSIDQSNESTAELSSFVSQVLNLPKPWYSTHHRSSALQMFHPEVESVTGTMQFLVDDYDMVTVTIVNSSGRLIKILLDESIYGPGTYDFPMRVVTDSWPKDEYTVEFESKTKGKLASYQFTI